MSSKLFTASLTGLDCQIIEVEVDYRKGNAYFSVVGLADKSIQEARDRIPAAIKNSGAEFIPMKIIMNLAPAEIIKSGPSYDLPLAIGYLLASDQVEFDPEGKVFIGELALDGRLRPVSGILPITDAIKKKGFKQIYLPADNASEAGLIEGIEIFSLNNLRELVDVLNKKTFITPFKMSVEDEFKKFSTVIDDQFDFKNIKGQLQAKRALEICASGGHNILLSGVPGSGKTLLARSLPSILPNLTVEEALEVTRIYSISGYTSKDRPIIAARPFRSPHHTSSQVALVGGGGQIKPGEISLSHRGILFLDEFPEFSPIALEALRQPLEDKIVTISRASGTLTFPASFILVAAMNPCKCGHLGDPDKECTCSKLEINKYQRKISGPILDRIDLLLNVPKVQNEKLFENTDSESSESISVRVQKAKEIQNKRFKDEKIFSNSEMNQNHLKKYAVLDEDCINLLKKAVNRLNLSARSYFRIIKVARTIADLEASIDINFKHIQEALSYRVEIHKG